MTTFQVLFFFAVFLVTLKVFKSRKRRDYNLAHGPRGFPFVGNNFQIAKNTHLKLSKWAEQYGKLYTITVGNGIPALVVNDVTTIKQIFSLTESTGRFVSEIHDAIFDGQYGILNSEGIVWREQREFCVKKLKSLGFNKSSYIEPKIISQVKKMCDWLEMEVNKGDKVVLNKILTETSGSTIWEIVTGQQPEKYMNLMINLMEKMQRASDTGLVFFSWIKHIAPEWSGYNCYLKACKKLHEYVRCCFAKCRDQVESDKGKHMVSAFIEHMKKIRDNENSCFLGEDGYKHSIQSVMSLLFAGVETTATTLHWLIFYLCVHPEVQMQVEKEIEEKVGNDRSPSLEDRESMPYTEAVILETLRKSSIAPVGLFQRLLDDVTYENYKLPKDLILIANLYHAHHDKNIWGDPENFRPERFLDNEFGDKKTMNGLKHFVLAFQAGKRVCPGEQMAKEVLFLFMTGLFQKFSFSMEDGVAAKTYMEPVVGIMSAPNNLCVKVIKRK